MRNWLTDQAIQALFDRLQKNPIRIGGINAGRDLIIWVVPSKESSKKSSKKGS